VTPDRENKLAKDIAGPRLPYRNQAPPPVYHVYEPLFNCAGKRGGYLSIYLDPAKG
jgi:hypothetical protein